jgi:hypothetical protein
MKVATFADLLAMPAGTIYSPVVEGYSDGLTEKGRSDNGAFPARELTPQDFRRKGPEDDVAEHLEIHHFWYWIFEEPPGDPPDIYHVFEAKDLAELVAILMAAPQYPKHLPIVGRGQA